MLVIIIIIIIIIIALFLKVLTLKNYLKLLVEKTGLTKITIIIISL